MLAKEKVTFVPFMVPLGVSASTNTAVDPAALSVFTVAFNPFTRLVKLLTLVVRPPTVLLTDVSEFVLLATDAVSPFKLEVKLLIVVP